MTSRNELDDDPIVGEHNVYLSHHAARKLFLFDYVSRSTDRSYEYDEAQVKVKLNVPKVEFQIPLQGCEGYLRDRDFNLVISSKKPSVNLQNCAIGVLKNGDLHLCSSVEVLQMYSNVDEYLSKTSNVKDADENECDADNMTMSIVTPRVASRLTEAERHRQMYESIKMKEIKEPWVSVVTKPAESHVLNSILCHSLTPAAKSEFNMTPDEYIQQFLPPVQTENKEKTETLNVASAAENNSATTSQNNESEDELVNFAIEKLKSRTVMSLQDFQTQVNMAFCLPKTKTQLTEALCKAGGVNISGKSANPMYATKSKGDRKDPIRECLVNLLQTKQVMKLSSLKSELDKHGLGGVPDGELKLVLKEYCFTKGGSWISKAHPDEDNQKPRKAR